MKYFIDHEKKRIHHSQHAGDQCEFVSTPIEKREFTTSLSYIEKLVYKSNYSKCHYCREVLMTIKRINIQRQ